MAQPKSPFLRSVMSNLFRPVPMTIVIGAASGAMALLAFAILSRLEMAPAMELFVPTATFAALLGIACAILVPSSHSTRLPRSRIGRAFYGALAGLLSAMLVTVVVWSIYRIGEGAFLVIVCWGASGCLLRLLLQRKTNHPTPGQAAVRGALGGVIAALAAIALSLIFPGF